MDQAVQHRWKDIAFQSFERIRREFPWLEFHDDTRWLPIEWAVILPKQPGLDFELSLSLQSDELYLSGPAGFWASYFPCDDPAKVDKFVDAVSGLISGKYRVSRVWLGPIPLGATLQIPKGNGWRSVAGGFFSSAVPSFLRIDVVNQNRPK